MFRDHMTELSWQKPVLVFYREKADDPEREPIAVVRARRLVVGKEGEKIKGSIEGFFPFMGDVEQLAGSQGTYVVCWMDDRDDDFDRAWRRLEGFRFQAAPSLTEGRPGKFGERKRTYNADFEGKSGKLE